MLYYIIYYILYIIYYILCIIYYIILYIILYYIMFILYYIYMCSLNRGVADCASSIGLLFHYISMSVGLPNNFKRTGKNGIEHHFP